VPPIAIVPLHVRDQGFIADLSREAFEDFSDDPATVVRDLIGRRGAITRVARCGGRALGFAIMNPAPDGEVAWLNAIAVQARWRGVGIGRRLLAAVERPTAALGVTEIRLHTSPHNLAALDLFLKCGYAICDRHVRFYRGGQGAVEMRKVLAPLRG
jgi:ribosomal protein S18 acetylase RimI-like enzyme